MTRDWAAGTYHRVSAPHLLWADAILARLPLRGDETILDAGCGSGRVTAKLVDRVPRGHVIAVDGSPAMVAQARENLPSEVLVLEQDLLALEAPEPVDAVFSSAVFHWIGDHPRLFARLAASLKPGGRLVAQCGGKGNIDGFRAQSDAIAARAPYGEHLGAFAAPWNYATPEETEERLRAAGFCEARAWLEPWPVVPPEPADFLRAVCLGPHLDALPEELRDSYVGDVLATLDDPPVLDYVRLNIDAVRG